MAYTTSKILENEFENCLTQLSKPQKLTNPILKNAEKYYAQYEDDKLWYLCEIITVYKNENNSVLVRFLDYGNFQICEFGDLRSEDYEWGDEQETIPQESVPQENEQEEDDGQNDVQTSLPIINGQIDQVNVSSVKHIDTPPVSSDSFDYEESIGNRYDKNSDRIIPNKQSSCKLPETVSQNELNVIAGTPNNKSNEASCEIDLSKCAVGGKSRLGLDKKEENQNQKQDQKNQKNKEILKNTGSKLPMPPFPKFTIPSSDQGWILVRRYDLTTIRPYDDTILRRYDPTTIRPYDDTKYAGTFWGEMFLRHS